MKPEKKNIALSEEEKSVLKIIKNNSSSSKLIEIKTESGLSNKKWDKTIKSLTKNKLVIVKKVEDTLLIELVD
jgi:lysyl-tRNA synthetase class 2